MLVHERAKDLYKDLEALKTFKVLIIGAGGIGSFAAPVLAKMGITTLQVWDFDLIEDVNIDNQNYLLNQVNLPKVEALQTNIKEYTGEEIEIREATWEGKDSDLAFDPDVILTAVDSMTARQKFWPNIVQNVINNNRRTKILVDARMSALQYDIFVTSLDPESKSFKQYEKIRLYSDDDPTVLAEPCTAKATIFTTSTISGMIGKIFFDIVNGNRVYRQYHGDFVNYVFNKSRDVI